MASPAPRTTSELVEHLESLLRTQAYNGATPNLVPLHVETLEEIIAKLRHNMLPPQVEKAVNGELGTHGDIVG